MNAEGSPQQPASQPGDQNARTDDGLSSLPALTRGLLEQVLEEMEPDGREPEQPDLAALLQVVRKYRGQPLSLEPVLVELVEAMLMRQFAQSAPNENWKAISRDVADKLNEDPRSQSRLHELWRRLSQRQE